MTIYLDLTNSLRRGFEEIKFIHVSRDEKAHDDALANLASAIDRDGSQSIPVVHLQWPVVWKQDDQSIVMDIESGECWMTPMIDYLQYEKLPVDQN